MSKQEEQIKLENSQIRNTYIQVNSAAFFLEEVNSAA